jgi:hypothetical protein
MRATSSEAMSSWTGSETIREQISAVTGKSADAMTSGFAKK